jgi:hypothetical protein
MTETPRKRASKAADKPDATPPVVPPDKPDGPTGTLKDGLIDTTSPPVAPEPAAPPVTSPAPPAAKVQKVGAWHLVTRGSWQVSVGPDGLLMLPRHLHPDEWDEFVASAEIAKDVGQQVIAANNAKEQAAPTGLSSRRAIVTQGPPPAGTVRMQATTAHQRAATIGRPKRPPTAIETAQQRPTRRSLDG